MFRVLWNGKNAMMANQERLDAISNNLSNTQTTGYKRVDVGFKDLMSETLERQGYPSNGKGAYTGTGVRTTSILRDNMQGALRESDKKTDFALDGQGYFRVIKADGTYAYTRDGSFNTDREGHLVNQNGNFIDIQFSNGYNYGNVKFDNNNFSVSKSGEVYLNENNNFTHVGDIKVYNAIGSDSLISEGANLFVPKDGVNMEVNEDVDIHQGFLEASNVDMSTEFTNMIMTQRAFELGSKSIKTADEMWGMINNLKGR